jgi:hypothetical protein
MVASTVNSTRVMPEGSVEVDCTAMSSPSRNWLLLGGAVITTAGLPANMLHAVTTITTSDETNKNLENESTSRFFKDPSLWTSRRLASPRCEASLSNTSIAHVQMVFKRGIMKEKAEVSSSFRFLISAFTSDTLA